MNKWVIGCTVHCMLYNSLQKENNKPHTDSDKTRDKRLTLVQWFKSHNLQGKF